MKLTKGMGLGLLLAVTSLNAAPQNTKEEPKAKEAPKAAPAASPSAVKLSESMLTKQDYDQLFSGIVMEGSAIISAQFQAQGLTFDEAKNNPYIKDMLSKKFSYEYFTAANVKTMQEKFKETELKKIWQFYQTAEGKKWQEETRNIVGASIGGFQLDFGKMIPQLQAEMIEKAKAAKESEAKAKPEAKKS